MAKKLIDVMDTTFRDGFQSVFGARVLTKDFLPAVEAAYEAGIRHFEFGGGARFQALFFYLNENAFDMMDKFREIVGKEANLQTLARGINTVMLDTGSRELIDLHAKLFKKHGTDTIRNFDALNDVNNLKYSGEAIKKAGLNHEIVITIMDLPPGCKGAHDVAFYEKILREILDNEIEFDSLCFKDATGTSSPHKVYETISMAKRLLPEDIHVRLHTHETAGVSVSCYLAALDAGVDGIDLAAYPVSGGTSQPDILTMLHATKGTNFDLGGLDPEKILKYEDVLKDCLKDYFLPMEATQVLPIIPFSPMPGGALTANTQMMRDNNILDKFPEVIKAMRETVERGGFGTSVTPVSQFYFQQAFNNVMFGPWKQIAEGYGKMVLGYFGKTPVKPDPEIVKLASEQLKLKPTTENPLDIADRDPKKSIKYFRQLLEDNHIEINDENIFIAAACGIKGIEYLKGNGKVKVRKNSKKEEKAFKKTESYTVVVNGNRYSVHIAEGADEDIDIKPVQKSEKEEIQKSSKEISKSPKSDKEGEEIRATLPGGVLKILAKDGDRVKKGEIVMLLEAMKMEIEVVSPKDGVIFFKVSQGDTVENNQLLAIVE